MEKYDSFLITEKTTYKTEVKDKKMYFLYQINRKEKMFIIKLFINAIISAKIFLKEQPDYVITTGVLAMIPISLLAKLFGKKLIYIESFAKVTTPTETGKLLYKYADCFYVQWESMLKVYPNALFLGGIY